MIDFLYLQKAFNAYRKKHSHLQKDDKIIEIIDEAVRGKKLEKGISASHFRKYFPKYPDEIKEENRPDTEHWIKTFLAIIKVVTESTGDMVEWEKQEWVKNGRSTKVYFEVPALDENGNLMSLESSSFKVFYWSKKYKSINEGDLILKKSSNTALMNIIYQKQDHSINNVRITGDYFLSGNTCFINNLKRITKNSSFTASQIVFERNDIDDIFIGTYSSATYNSSTPYSGMIVLVKRGVDITKDLKSMINYLLFHKRFQPQVTNFSSDLTHRLHSLPTEVKMWLQIKENLAGMYIGYFANPFLKRFEKCLIEIEATGLVKIHVSALLNQPNKAYKGIVRMGTSRTTYHKLIIQADYFPDFLEYRVRLYLDAFDYLNSKDKCIRGTYTCLRLDDGKPFASKLVMKPLNKADEKHELIELISYTQVEDAEQYEKLKEFLHNEGVHRYFFDEGNNLLKSFSLFYDSL